MEKCKVTPKMWVTFNIYPELENVRAMTKARINIYAEIVVKLLFSPQRGYFYSYLENAKIEAKKLFQKQLNINYMEKMLLELLTLISDYAKKKDIPEGIELILESDGSGGTYDYFNKVEIFEFKNLGELMSKLEEEL